jgi:hypothetical protein
MSDIEPRALARPKIPAAGTAAIEFALLATFFFMLVFGIIEVSRLLYVFNTLQEVTRRGAVAAVNVYPSDTAAIAKVRQYAVFRDSPGDLPLAQPVTDQHIRLDYLAYDLSVIPQGSWPICAAQNRQICMANPHSSSCIRFVRVRVCDPAHTDGCYSVHSRMLVPLVPLSLPLPKAETIATVETLGYKPGTSPCAPLPPGT